MCLEFGLAVIVATKNKKQKQIDKGQISRLISQSIEFIETINNDLPSPMNSNQKPDFQFVFALVASDFVLNDFHLANSLQMLYAMV